MPSKGPLQLPWHPNFREASLLPDIKVIRSVFFINVVPMVLAFILLGVWGFIEWQLGGLRASIASNEKALQANKSSNEELLRRSSEFERTAKSISEIQSFVGVPFKPSAFLAAIGEARPASMTLSQISYAIEPRQEAPKSSKPGPDGKKPAPKNFAVYSITIAGSVSGASAQATRSVEAFRDKLEALPLFKGLQLNAKPALKSFDRDKSLDIYTFVINLEVRL